ncbi:MAG: hypothetical protein QXT86_10430 [Archaeoglobaceae archaeon]
MNWSDFWKELKQLPSDLKKGWQELGQDLKREIQSLAKSETKLVEKEKRAITAIETLDKISKGKLSGVVGNVKDAFTRSKVLNIIGRGAGLIWRTVSPSGKLGTIMTIGAITGPGAYFIYKRFFSSDEKPQVTETKPQDLKEKQKTVSPKMLGGITPEEEAYLAKALERIKRGIPYDPAIGKEVQNKIKGLEGQVEENANEVNKLLKDAFEFAEKLIAQENEILEKKRHEIYAEYEKLIEKLNELTQEKSEAIKEVILTTLEQQRRIMENLMQEMPSMGADEKTQFARSLALNLLAIASVFSPSEQIYFLSSLPKIVEYWRNEDLYSFDRKMREFQLKVDMAQTRLDFLANQMNLLVEMINSEYEVPVKTLVDAVNQTLKIYDYLYELQLNNFLSMKNIAMNLAKMISDQRIKELMYDLRWLQLLLSTHFRTEELKLRKQRLALDAQRFAERQKEKEEQTGSFMERLKRMLEEKKE